MQYAQLRKRRRGWRVSFLYSIVRLGSRQLIQAFAYAIEQVSGGRIRHGEAVAMGLVAAANLSARLGYCSINLQERIELALKKVNLPTHIPQTLSSESLLQTMSSDKKRVAGQLRFVLLRDVGRAFLTDVVSKQDILATLQDVSR